MSDLSDGSQVRGQFLIGNAGYESDWPLWAYNLASSALLANKQLYLLLSNEVPFGDYLLDVEILAQ
jgi:hypothetical protein